MLRPDRGRRWLAGCVLALLCAGAYAQPAAESGALGPAERARLAWEAGYVLHQLGDHPRAIEAYRASIAVQPSAEAYTFLGWALSHLGRIDEAIAQCKIAIELDPEFGNPYNDIGVYLIELGRPEEAVAWLNKAIAAKRYCCYQFAHYNLGRIQLVQGSIEAAQRSFERALEHDPHYLPALAGLQYIKQRGLQGL